MAALRAAGQGAAAHAQQQPAHVEAAADAVSQVSGKGPPQAPDLRSRSLPRPGTAAAAAVQQQNFRMQYRLTKSMGSAPAQGAAAAAAAAASAAEDGTEGLLLPTPQFSALGLAG